MIAHVMTLLMLTLLQAVLGFDNLLYISIESKRVVFQLNVHALIVLVGGAFIIYTAIKEIAHMMLDSQLSTGQDGEKSRSVVSAIFWITTMNLVFSFDSILSAIALASSPNPDPNLKAQVITMAGMVVMSLAILFSGLMMLWLSDRVSEFLQKNRMYEVLGLFILFIVGIMLVSEGGHLAHLKLFGHEVEPMAKSTFYFVLAVLVLVDIVQGRYQKKLLAGQYRGFSGDAT
ncbi:MAG: hypothetical protein R3C49_12690 [Planctomycetaceae bacterium]